MPTIDGQSHPLDRPIWNSLTSKQAHIAVGDGSARRFPVDVAPFADIADISSQSFFDLGKIVPLEGRVAMFTVEKISVPDGLTIPLAATMEQMVRTSAAQPERAAVLIDLDETDVDEILELVKVTNPGPFGLRTLTLGSYLGIREGGRLVAMAGERMKLDGFTEVSAVCTHPEFQGRGYGKLLVDGVSAGIVARGEVPFLHAFSTNTGAIEVYKRAGFSIRAQLHLTVVTHADR